MYASKFGLDDKGSFKAPQGKGHGNKEKHIEETKKKKIEVFEKSFDSKLLMSLRNRVPTFAPKIDDQSQTIDEIEFVEPVKIEPKISKLSAAGELTVEFDPPSSSVPDGWDALFDPVAKAKLTEDEKIYFESVISEVFSVNFV